MQQREDGKIMIAIGKTRCGKSSLIKAILKNKKRVLVSDPKNQYHAQMGYERFFDKHELIERLREVGEGDAQICFVPTSAKDFDFICDVAFTWNLSKPIFYIAEELANWSSSGRSVGHWGKVVNQGLEYGINILGTVQRGQEVDKTVMNAASYLHIMQHATEGDAFYIHDKTGIPFDKIPREPMKFVQWSDGAGLICEGTAKYIGEGANARPEFRIKGKVTALDENGMFKGQKY